MTRSLIRLLLGAIAALAVLAAAPAAMAEPSDQGLSHRAVCPAIGKESARCFARVVTDRGGKPLKGKPAATVSYNAAQLQQAYNLPSLTAGSGETIAIVDAYHSPTAESDLAKYRIDNSLPPCTSASGCFRQLNQRGQEGPYPATDTGWAQEISLDLDMASAICPNCKLVLVEADTATWTNIAASVRTASGISGVHQVSNSYGNTEFFGQDDSAYSHSGVTMTVSSGDNGYRAEFPASSPYVTAVGGTSLRRDSAGNWSETAWSGAGSGCSAIEPAVSWQPAVSGCTHRLIADVSAVADPNTGVRVVYNGNTYAFGGTSASAPIIAGVYALQPGGDGPDAAQTLYSAPGGSLYDVTSGSNGHCRSAPVLCTAGPEWDGPTGVGTPRGSAAF